MLCLGIGFPVALAIAFASPRTKTWLLMLIMLPFWTNLLIRTFALVAVLRENGYVNFALEWLWNNASWAMTLAGFQPLGEFEPLKLLYNNAAVVVGLVYVHLPFMVLPLYANLVKMDFRLLEAAYDLGATPLRAFWLVTVPLSKAGIVAGFMLVFIPSVGEFVIPSLLGGPENLMIGRVVWDEMFTSNNWPRASALAVVLILFIVVPLAIYYHYTGEKK